MVSPSDTAILSLISCLLSLTYSLLSASMTPVATTPTQGLRTPPIARCGPFYLRHQHDRFRCPLRRESRAGLLRLGRANDHKPVLM